MEPTEATHIGEFLRSRRARVRPADVGLPDRGRRRVPGLRREELARLAGVSVDSYVRLEQGRAPNLPIAALEAIARTLQLDDGERSHLLHLARPPRPRVTGPRHAAPGSSGRTVRSGVQALIDRLDRVPAVVLGPGAEVLAWNPLADAVYGFAEGLTGDFAVPESPSGRTRVTHPVAGVLELAHETLTLSEEPEQLVVTFVAADAESEDRLRMLASWHAPMPEDGE